MKWTPDTIIAAVVIVGGLGLKFCDIDGEVWSLVLMAAGWVFGSQYQARKLLKGG